MEKKMIKVLIYGKENDKVKVEDIVMIIWQSFT